jgi:hypothetical protein
MNIQIVLDKFLIVVSNFRCFSNFYKGFVLAIHRYPGISQWFFCLSRQVHAKLLNSFVVSFLIIKVNALILPGGSYIRDRLLSIGHDGGKGQYLPLSAPWDQYDRGRHNATVKIYIYCPEVDIRCFFWVFFFYSIKLFITRLRVVDIFFV